MPLTIEARQMTESVWGLFLGPETPEGILQTHRNGRLLDTIPYQVRSDAEAAAAALTLFLNGRHYVELTHCAGTIYEAYLDGEESESIEWMAIDKAHMHARNALSPELN